MVQTNYMAIGYTEKEAERLVQDIGKIDKKSIYKVYDYLQKNIDKFKVRPGWISFKPLNAGDVFYYYQDEKYVTNYIERDPVPAYNLALEYDCIINSHGGEGQNSTNRKNELLEEYYKITDKYKEKHDDIENEIYDLEYYSIKINYEDRDEKYKDLSMQDMKDLLEKYRNDMEELERKYNKEIDRIYDEINKEEKNTTSYWDILPISIQNKGEVTDVNTAVLNAISCGYKKILIFACNPYHFKLSEEIMKVKGVIVRMSNNVLFGTGGANNYISKSKKYYVYDNLGVKNKFKSFFNRNKYKNESTGLAGIGGVVGTMQPFITQYGPNATFTKNDKDNIEGYALSNDIITKNVLIVDKDGKIKKKDSSFLEGRKIRMFKYIGEDTTTLEDINKIIGKYGYREIFYEILSNKKLLSDDQILCDECFEEVSLSEIHEEKVSAIQTLIDGIKFITGEEVNKLPLMNESDIIKANDIIDDNQNIEIFENEYGYFAENVLTHKRTGYYKSINKIQIKPIII
jgi:hypothetical protein